MTNTNNMISKNIKSLRIAYGESQLDLALSIELDSPNAIANYEKGIRIPKPEIRKRIAKHYRITEEELMYSDFSGLHFPKSIFGDKEKMIEMSLEMFPVIKTEQAIRNAEFRTGFEAHLRIIEAMKNSITGNDSDYDVCFESYDKCEMPEATANILGLFLLLEIFMKNQWMRDGAEALSKNRINGDELLKKYYLKDFDDMSESQGFSEDMNEREMSEFEECISDLLKELRKHSEWSDLVDYYVAIRYLHGCVDNSQTDEMNKAIGGEMLLVFAQFGNVYAKKFLRKGVEFA